MATKWNNSKLLIVFLILIGVFFLVRYLNSSKTKGNFDPNVIELDTARISEILLYPKTNGQKEIRLFQENNQWMAQKGDFKVKAMNTNVLSLINAIQTIKPTRLAARSEDKWERFQVNDSLATKVKVKLDGGEEIALMIGKFSYKQAPQANQYQQQGIKTISYFRIDGEKEVYATEGFLTMTFNRDINAFRDQTFIKTKKEDVKKMTFQLSGDSAYLVQQIDSNWTINGMNADKAKVDQLLVKLESNNQSQFVDNFNSDIEPDYSLLIEGDNMDPIDIMTYDYDSSTVIMSSSLNKGARFKIPKSGLFSELFKPADYYLDSIQ